MEPPQAEVGSVGLRLAAVLALVLANAFFVAVEFALVGARKTRLEELAAAGDRKATLALKAIQSLSRYLAAAQLGITVASLGLGWIGEPALAQLFDQLFTWLPAGLRKVASHSVAVIIAFSLITSLHITLGEQVPKSIAIVAPEQSSRWLAAPLIVFAWVMAIPTRLLNNVSNWTVRLLGLKPPGEQERVHSPEEIRMLVEQSQEHGSLGAHNARMLEGVFEFSEKTAEEVMTPRTDVVAIAAEASVEAAADVVAEAKKSRYPVYNESLDEIAGIVHAKDILRALRQGQGSKVGTLVRPPLFVPGTREVEDVLTDMKRLKTHMAVVLDEYGGTAGVVTMEDLLEEIVGQIVDEFDMTMERPMPLAGTLVLDGATPISSFNSDYDESLSDTDYTTIGGWIFGQLGRLPQVGDRVAAGRMSFEVVEMEGRRVKRVKLIAGSQGIRGSGDQGVRGPGSSPAPLLP
ncbi:MAG TPA: hemolysin family protein [Gemmatimonadales bacterium]|jgi:CBS domain containing-hemolysin-like protein|nr:hemolysin family protein [Gemmatimonadales bacterium]